MNNLIKLGSHKELPSGPGIYEIINSNTKCMYVGSSKNIRKRLVNHVWELKNNKHSNALIQNSFNKHGLDIFEVRFTETGTEEESRVLEQSLLDSGNYKYNLSKLATSGCIPGDSVCVYDFEGIFLETYTSVYEASKFLSISSVDIAYSAIGLVKTVNGKYFRFSNPNYKNKLDVELPYSPSETIWAKFWFSNNYIIRKWDYNGNKLGEFTNVQKLCSEVNVTFNMLRKHLSGTYISLKGAIYSFTDEFPGASAKIRNRPVLRLNKEGVVLERYEYPYIKKLEVQGYPYSVIIDALSLRRGTNYSKGMYWKYDDNKSFVCARNNGAKSKLVLTSLDTGATQIFESLNETCKFLGTNRSTLSRYIKDVKAFKNYKLEYLHD